MIFYRCVTMADSWDQNYFGLSSLTEAQNKNLNPYNMTSVCCSKYQNLGSFTFKFYLCLLMCRQSQNLLITLTLNLLYRGTCSTCRLVSQSFMVTENDNIFYDSIQHQFRAEIQCFRDNICLQRMMCLVSTIVWYIYIYIYMFIWWIYKYVHTDHRCHLISINQHDTMS
jgi:hypothetical protein